MADYLNTFAISAARFSRNLSDGLMRASGDYSLTATALESAECSRSAIQQLLESNQDAEKVQGLQRIISLQALGSNVTEYFPQVVKIVASNSIEVRKLVYIYLLRNSQMEPDLALLSINTFQKDLSDPNQSIRSLALKVLSGIPLPVISPIVMRAVEKCANDISPIVRSTTAFAIAKLNSHDPSLKEDLTIFIGKLLEERTTFTISSAVAAYKEVCPENEELLKTSYLKLCTYLLDVDEWGQSILLNMMLRFAPKHFPQPQVQLSVNEAKELDRVCIHPHLQLLLDASRLLFFNRNDGVVLEAVKLFYFLAPRCLIKEVVPPLLRLLRNSKEKKYIVLKCIASICYYQSVISLFGLMQSEFFVRVTDSPAIRKLKLEIMVSIVSEKNITSLLRELQQYIHSPQRDFAIQVVRAIGASAYKIPHVTENCLSGLLSLLKTETNEDIITESVIVIGNLLRQREVDNVVIITKLGNLVFELTSSMAKSCILKLIGEYCTELKTVAPDVLRRFIKSFKEETVDVKLQVLSLGAKLIYTFHTEKHPLETTLQLMFTYLIELARYDLNYDIRDKARFMVGICSEKSYFRQYWSFIFGDKEKLTGNYELSKIGSSEFYMGSLSFLINSEVAKYQKLPEWKSGLKEVDFVSTPVIVQPEISIPASSSMVLFEKSEEDLNDFYSEPSDEEIQQQGKPLIDTTEEKEVSSSEEYLDSSTDEE